MIHMNEIYERANIQQIRNFLLYGADCVVDPHSYQERIANAQNDLFCCICSRFAEGEQEEVANLIYRYGSANEEVYMEIGLQVGAMLAMQVWQNGKAAFEAGKFEAWLSALKCRRGTAENEE